MLRRNNGMAKGKNTKPKSNKTWLVLLLVVILLLAYTIITYLRQMREEEAAQFARYPAFGIDLPLGYSIHGIDVSKHQGYIAWPMVKAMQVQDVRPGFAFIKATEGLLNVDAQFKRNWQQAKDAGLYRGAYHFFLATKSGKLQAQNFISTVQLLPGDLPPVLDIEELYGVAPAIMRKEAKAWLQAVEAAYQVKPIIYTNTYFYNTNLGKDFDDYPLWAAHYLEKDKPRINRDWLFWQHSDAGNVNGITTKVDFNVFNGDSTAFHDLLIK